MDLTAQLRACVELLVRDRGHVRRGPELADALGPLMDHVFDRLRSLQCAVGKGAPAAALYDYLAPEIGAVEHVTDRTCAARFTLRDGRKVMRIPVQHDERDRLVFLGMVFWANHQRRDYLTSDDPHYAGTEHFLIGMLGDVFAGLWVDGDWKGLPE